MSLFSSAFANSSAGPSYTSVNPTKGASTKSNKRKRSIGKDDDLRKQAQVNLDKLMKKVEGGKSLEKKDGDEPMGVINKKHKRKSSDPTNHHYTAPANDRKASSISSSVTMTKNKKSKKQLETTKQTVKTTEDGLSKAYSPSNSSKLAPAEIPLPHDIHASNKQSSSSDAGFTKMQRDMKAKLEGARFRWINEQLYSNPSTEAVAMMKKDPKIFEDYHLTHRALTSAWPSPPLPHIIDLLSPLSARTVIVDLGCGDAGLAKALVPQGKIVMSYDLVGDRGVPSDGYLAPSQDQGKANAAGWVVEADFLESVPLPGRAGGDFPGSNESGEVPAKRSKKGKIVQSAGGSEIVDVVVCCLSLMGTNWVGGIYEACRILKQGGTFHIAEVTSRFTSTEEFITTVQSFGFDLITSSSPSTHFTLFAFKKSVPAPLGTVRGEPGWEERVKGGESVMRACVYKKR